MNSAHTWCSLAHLILTRILHDGTMINPLCGGKAEAVQLPGPVSSSIGDKWAGLTPGEGTAAWPSAPQTWEGKHPVLALWTWWHHDTGSPTLTLPHTSLPLKVWGTFTKGKWMVAGDCGEGIEELVFNGKGISVWENEKGLDVNNHYPLVMAAPQGEWMYLMPPNWTL